VATGGQSFPPGLAGWTVSTWTFDLAPGASATLDLTCPSGKAIAAIGPDGAADPGPVTVLTSPGDYVPLYGSKGRTLTATASTGQPGTGTFMTACLPSVRSRTTIVHGRSPVTIPNSGNGVGLKKGAVIPHTWRLYSFALGPSRALAKGPVTVYTLCSSLNQ
jgi:hypothetical protein